MPLAGTLCCQTGQPQTFDNCMAEARAGRCQHTVPLLAAMKKNGEARKGIGISTSVLGACPRQFVLSERNDYYEDPELCYPRWIGTFSHYAVELGGPYPGIVQEHRFYRSITVDGVEFELSGQPDWVDTTYPGGIDIQDSKFVAFAPAEPYESHVAQLNVYSWLVEGGGAAESPPDRGVPIPRSSADSPIPAGLDVVSLRVNYYHGPSGKPKRRHTSFEVAQWTDDAIERYITDRLRPHAQFIRTGNYGVLKAPEDFKFGASCPFLHPDNPGRCCMESQVAQNLARAASNSKYMDVDTSLE